MPHLGDNPDVRNRAIEIHDSELDQITTEGADAVLHFPHVYIHASEGRPAIDPGTGWSQKAVLRIANARVEGSFSEESRAADGGVVRLVDGALLVNGSVSENLIPIPLDVTGDVTLRLRCRNTVSIYGDAAKLELVGDAEYIEKFDPRSS